MLYIAYLPKPKGELYDDRKIHKILTWYTKLTQDKYSIIAAPGYFSTTDASIEDYLFELTRLLTNDGDVAVGNRKIGFLNGMNGHYNTTSGKNSIIAEHNKHLGGSEFGRIQLMPKKEFDHRKMMCFFCERGTEHPEITLDSLDPFLQTVHVGAVLIGSSNQSKTSYFEQKASKGETDVFLVDAEDDLWVQIALETLHNGEQGEWPGLLKDDDNIVITKSFSGKGHYDTQEFLKNILRELLTNGLDA